MVRVTGYDRRCPGHACTGLGDICLVSTGRARRRHLYSTCRTGAGHRPARSGAGTPPRPHPLPIGPGSGLLSRLGIAGRQIRQPPLAARPPAHQDHIALQPRQRRTQRRLARLDDRPLHARIVRHGVEHRRRLRGLPRQIEARHPPGMRLDLLTVRRHQRGVGVASTMRRAAGGPRSSNRPTSGSSGTWPSIALAPKTPSGTSASPLPMGTGPIHR
jgi:hypothetical protein